MAISGNSKGGRRSRTQRGVAIIELALVLPLLVILVLLTVDFGRLVQSRLIISNVSREGGSLASRQSTVDTTLATLLTVSARPLDLSGSLGRIIVTRLTAGTSSSQPNPTVTVAISSGSLAVTSQIGTSRSYYGLTQPMYHHLVWQERDAATHAGMADISELTVVEVYYKYKPITPLPQFLSGMLTPDGDGMVVWSKAVF